MNNTIDLHGKSHEEALIIVEDYLLLNSFDNLLDLYKITKYEIDRFYCVLTNLFNGFLVFNFLSISGSIFYFGLAQRGKIR